MYKKNKKDKINFFVVILCGLIGSGLIYGLGSLCNSTLIPLANPLFSALCGIGFIAGSTVGIGAYLGDIFFKDNSHDCEETIELPIEESELTFENEKSSVKSQSRKDDIKSLKEIKEEILSYSSRDIAYEDINTKVKTYQKHK